MVRSNYKSRSDFVTAVFDKYQLKMQTIACGILHDTHLSEDAVSEAMIKIIKNADMIDDIESRKCANFVYTITKNTALDFYRKRQKERENGIHTTSHETISDVSCELFEAKYGFGEEINFYISQLSQTDIDIIALKYGDDFSYKEIALILEQSEDSIRQRASRARKKLESIIQKGGSFDDR